MGLDLPSLEFLCAAKNHGVDFSDLITLGDQGFWPDSKFWPDTKGFDESLRALSVKGGKTIENAKDFYAKALGTKTLSVLDYSDYEGATIIHDLNYPIPPELRNRFGVVYDGGTMEHVFNLPKAYKNVMEMVRVGGWFAQCAVANNFVGHGFWQVSPETIFRCFTPENGFELHAVLLKECYTKEAWHAARDPAIIGRRVELLNKTPTYIFTLARKTADVEVFATMPQQSDYATAWSAGRYVHPPAAPWEEWEAGDPAWLKKTKKFYRRVMPPSARGVVLGTRRKIAKLCGWASPYGRDQYVKLDQDAFLHGDLGPLARAAASSNERPEAGRVSPASQAS